MTRFRCKIKIRCHSEASSVARERGTCCFIGKADCSEIQAVRNDTNGKNTPSNSVPCTHLVASRLLSSRSYRCWLQKLHRTNHPRRSNCAADRKQNPSSRRAQVLPWGHLHCP